MEPTARSAATSQQRSYEDFEPTTEWKREPNADTLLVYLPGFRKDQLKVQVTSSRQLRITGERPSGNNNKWSRFKKEMPIGSNYEANEIGARFDKGVLYVKHPKLIPNGQPAPPIAAGNQFPPLQKPQPLPPRPAAAPTTPRPPPPQQDMRRPAPAAAVPPSQPPAWRPVQDQKPSSADSGNGKATAAAAPTTGQPITPPLPEPSMWKIPPPEPISLPPADKNQETSDRASAAAGAVAASHSQKKADDGNGGRGDGSSADIRRRASSMVMASGEKLKEAAMSSGSGVMDMTRKDPKKLVNLVLAVMAAVVIVMFMIKNVAVKSICKFKGDYLEDDLLL
ncbi:Inactive protein RESTRICTED TEV MOVEMENT 2 [Linum grandiflorum]